MSLSCITAHQRFVASQHACHMNFYHSAASYEDVDIIDQWIFEKDTPRQRHEPLLSDSLLSDCLDLFLDEIQHDELLHPLQTPCSTPGSAASLGSQDSQQDSLTLTAGAADGSEASSQAKEDSVSKLSNGLPLSDDLNSLNGLTPRNLLDGPTLPSSSSLTTSKIPLRRVESLSTVNIDNIFGEASSQLSDNSPDSSSDAYDAAALLKLEDSLEMDESKIEISETHKVSTAVTESSSECCHSHSTVPSSPTSSSSSSSSSGGDSPMSDDDFVVRLDRKPREHLATVRSSRPTTRSLTLGPNFRHRTREDPFEPLGPPSPSRKRKRDKKSGGCFYGPPALKHSRGGCSSPPKKKAHPKEAVAYLNAWLEDHLDKPYPSEREKQEMSINTGLQIHQINIWFTNARARRLKGRL